MSETSSTIASDLIDDTVREQRRIQAETDARDALSPGNSSYRGLTDPLQCRLALERRRHHHFHHSIW